MRLGHAVWRQLGNAAASSARREAPRIPDLPALASELELLPQLERKPWVLLSDARQAFEQRLELGTDELLLLLSQWLERATAAPAAAGLAHVSGNVYLGPSLDLKQQKLPPEQVLLGSLFSHGEIGLDAFASPSPPAGEAAELLRELATFKRLRWLDASVPVSLGAAAVQEAPAPVRQQREMGEIVKPAKKSLFKKYPLASSLLSAGEVKGNCLQHPNFVHHDIEGNSIEEFQISLAKIASKRAYLPPSLTADGRTGGGCALRTDAGLLFAGSEVATTSGMGGLSPLKCALISLGANGLSAEAVLGAAWCGAGDAAERLRREDETLLAALVPGASFDFLAVE